MTLWPPSRDRLTRPVYRAIAQALADAVDAGEIGDGMRLPPHRTLAFHLGVSVHTVSRAYEELSRIGLIRGEVGRGSFVKVGSTDAQMPWQAVGDSEDVIDLSMLVPVRSPEAAAMMRATLAELSENLPDTSFQSFRPRKALQQHCDAARQWIAQCGVVAPRARILPTNGCSSAITVALMTIAMPGDVILTDAYGHHTLKALCTALGVRLSGVSMDAEGMIPEALDEAAGQGARAIFVMPAGIGPTTAIMGNRRRKALIDVVRRRDLMIVENDAWAPVTGPAARPLAAMAPERSLYITGLSKFTVPGLRIGWLVVPDRLVAAARTRHLATAWMATPLIAEIASRWISAGTVARMLAFQKAQFTRRNILAQKALGHLDLRACKSGMHVWLDLPKTWNVSDFVAAARRARVAVGASENFQMTERPVGNGVRICLGGTSEGRLAEGLRLLAGLAESEPGPVLPSM